MLESVLPVVVYKVLFSSLSGATLGGPFSKVSTFLSKYQIISNILPIVFGTFLLPTLHINYF